MAIPNSVLAGSRERLDFDPERRKEELKSAKPIEANSAERVQTWIAEAAIPVAQGEGVGLERIINGNDLKQINYLERGVDAARSVGRISIIDAAGEVQGFGTGFLIAPRLLMTNNHVFGDAETARTSIVEFNYQLDIDGKRTVQDAFEFDPDACFVTSKELDFTIVAVKQTSERNVPLSKYANLRFDATPGKTLDAQFLTIIQHPSGERKQIAIRENQLLRTQENFLWYATDTAPGSSGSCVFNDAWQLVALHHSGVPRKDANGNILARDGRVWEPSMGDDAIDWMANEGVRISSIAVELRKHTQNALIAALLGAAPAATEAVIVEREGVSVAPATFEKISIDPNYDNRQGYNPAFLGTGVLRVPLPKIPKNVFDDEVAHKTVDDAFPSHILTYHHYSVVQHKKRRIALFTAVNIDGNQSIRLKRDKDQWFYDPRIDRAAQVGNELYANNDLDRGHLVRRLDPAWGTTKEAATIANDDTFHWTNCSPQHKDFNQGANLWAGLEDYVLENADNRDLKVSVFTGPVFRDSDRVHPATKVPIPDEFWKVVVMAKANGKLSATAYLVSQKKLVAAAIEEAAFTFGKYRTFQVPISRVEQLTGLQFGLSKYDPKATGAAPFTEAASPAAEQPLLAYEQITL